MTDHQEPKLPEPVYSVFVRGNLQDTLPYAPAWTLKDGVHALVTAASALAYAEALAEHRVAQERERCARICETPLPIATSDSALDMMQHFGEKFAADIRQQPPETDKGLYE